MHVSAQQLLLALVIGGEVFAIAALWPLSEWAVTAPRRGAQATALAVIVACVALETYGLGFSERAPAGWHSLIASALEWTTVPLFIALPDAACVASGQSLARAGVSVRVARAVALGVAAVAAMAAPFATIVAGCGMAGACF
ncbi:MAG: hypothetical protein ABJD97_18715 [Betaproteobacteria bacterium]